MRVFTIFFESALTDSDFGSICCKSCEWILFRHDHDGNQESAADSDLQYMPQPPRPVTVFQTDTMA